MRRLFACRPSFVASVASVWLSAQNAPPPARIRGFSEQASAAEAAHERELKALPSAKAAGSRLRRDDRRAAQHRLAVRDQARRLHRRQLQAARLRRVALRVQRPAALAEGAPHRHRRARRREAAGRRGHDSRRSVGDEAGHPAGVQRVFAVRRRHRRHRVRELRHPGGLRDAEEARRRRQRQDRPRALRRQLARHQAEGRGRARRHRLHHLFRSARRRLFSGGCVSGWSVPRAGHDSARQRDGHAALSRRSVHARSAVEAGRRAPADGQDRDVRGDSGPADVVSRRTGNPEAAEGARRARSVARRAADHVSRRPGAGEGAHDAADGLRAAPPHRRRRQDYRRGVPGRVGDRRIASRRVGLRRVRLGQRPRVDDERRARDESDDEERLEAAAQHPLRELGRRGARAARVDRVRRGSRERS